MRQSIDGESGTTDFSVHSHGELISMVKSMKSAEVMAAADPWRRAAETLDKVSEALRTATTDATSTWQGSSSEAFSAHVTELASQVEAASSYAHDAAGTLELMSIEIDTARNSMPDKPGFFDTVTDAVGDAAQQAVGIDNYETQHTIAESRKEEAVGVMRILAANYKAATGYLRVPNGSRWEDSKENVSSDSSGQAGLIAAIAAAGLGTYQPGARVSGSAGSQTSSKGLSTSRAPQAPKVQPAVVRPTDAGISGGTANAVSQPKGPGTGIDGIQGGVRGGTVSAGGSGGVHAPAGGNGLSGGVGGSAGQGGGTLGSGTGLGVSRAGFSGSSAAKAGTFGSGGLNSGSTATGGAGAAGRAGGAGSGGAGAGGLGGGAGSGSGGGAPKGRSSSGLAGKAGGVVGETSQGGAGGRAFSQGGSGIGRNRFGQGATGGAGQAGAVGQGGAAGNGAGMAGQGQGSKRAKKGTTDRPDYLVEDEETWASGGNANPNVVE